MTSCGDGRRRAFQNEFVQDEYEIVQEEFDALGLLDESPDGEPNRGPVRVPGGGPGGVLGGVPDGKSLTEDLSEDPAVEDK